MISLAQALIRGAGKRDYTIDHIVKHVDNNRQRKYVLHWHGYKSLEDTIEPPEQNLEVFINQNWEKTGDREDSGAFSAKRNDKRRGKRREMDGGKEEMIVNNCK